MTYYKDVIKSNPEKYEKEKERVRDALNLKYEFDEEYRQKRILYQREYRLRKKQEKLMKENI